ncbi:hypothetical protein QE152_g37437 [Popillia japonica]|uniref:Histone-lysine N-methyltransferase SETMAR n=1 Tax=Popillia japonica TaxID=7064 RepID=A0AAW1IAM3_POPJA
MRKEDAIGQKSHFLHDNPKPHVANLTREELEIFRWEILEHPSYSGDPFGPLKEALGGQRFDDNEAVEGFMLDWLHERPRVSTML